MSQKHSVVICDDHAIFREGLKQVLSANPSLEISGEAADGLEALEAIRRTRPHLVITDITMPGLNGIDLTKEVVRESSQTKVVILSVHSRKTFIMEALKAGARGYVLKDSAGEKLLDAVEAVLNGNSYLDSPVAGHIIDEFVRMPSATEGAVSGGEPLTDRERQILILVVEGHTNKQIAEKLFLSPKTVDNHRAKLMAKLGRRDVIGLAKYAVATGLVDPDSWGR